MSNDAGAGFGILVVVVLVGWGVASLLGVSFGVENTGTVTYGDCRQIITIQDHSWRTYMYQFTCSYDKTKSGQIMDGTCVHVINDSSLFSSNHTCATAYVYQKQQAPGCTVAPNLYLGYDDMCYTTPQAGEAVVSSASNDSPTTVPSNQAITADPSTGALPTEIGQCDGTTISQIGTRLVDGTTGQNVEGSGSAINYADGGYQVSYDTVSSVQDWSIGDQVNLCLVSVPTNCPPGDNRGKVYDATNIRTGETWEAQDSEHSCGGT